MYGIHTMPISKMENKVSHIGAKYDVDMEKDTRVNWCNDPAEQGGLMTKYSPTKLR